MMIGSPGTGKSMLAKAMSELLPKEELQDVLVYHNPDDGNKPKVRTVPAGKGDQIVDAHREEARKRNQMRSLLMWIIIAVVLGYALIIVGQILVGIIAAGVVYLVFRYLNRGSDAMIPNLLVNNGDTKTAPFRDATGAHAGALLGDVRHDPFQSGGMETPSHDRVEAGAIHKANKGVLFIDEINTLDIRSQHPHDGDPGGRILDHGPVRALLGCDGPDRARPDRLRHDRGREPRRDGEHAPGAAEPYQGVRLRGVHGGHHRGHPRDASEVRSLHRSGGREGRSPAGVLGRRYRGGHPRSQASLRPEGPPHPPVPEPRRTRPRRRATLPAARTQS